MLRWPVHLKDTAYRLVLYYVRLTWLAKSCGLMAELAEDRTSEMLSGRFGEERRHQKRFSEFR